MGRLSGRKTWLALTVLCIAAALYPAKTTKAQDVEERAAIEEDVLTMDAAARQALSYDKSARIARLNLENARIVYKKNMAVNLLSDSAYQRRSAEAGLRSAEITYAHRRADIVMQVVDRYFTLISRELDLDAKKAQLEVARIHLDGTRRKADLGTAGRLDVYDAQVEVGSAELNVNQASHQLAEAQEALGAMVNVEPDRLLPLDRDPVTVLETLPDISLEEAVERALLHSTALIGAESALELAVLEQEQAKAEGVAPLDQQAADLKVEIARLEKEQAEREVRLQVRAAYEEVMRAQEALSIEAIQTTLSEERYALVRQQFEVGLKTQSEAIEGEVSRIQARQRSLATRRQYVNAVLTFKKMIGESFSYDDEH